MNSSSADPDCDRMACLRASTDAWLASISSVTIAGSVSIEAGAPPGGGPAGTSSGSVGMKSPRSTRLCSASPISGSPWRIISSRPARLVGEASRSKTSTNNLPPASCITGSAVS